MNELQATVEFSVELYKFYNVDLFQRGYYQVRTSLRNSPRLASRIEICLPTSTSEKGQLASSQLIFPPCIVNGSAVSKTFQILYRNEEVILNDVVLFKAHLVVDSKKVEENLLKADFQLTVELWFTEQPFGPDHHSSIVCVSSRVLKLHLSPAAGLHHHLPVLFDYFHLSAVSTTVHGFLLAVHQPYVNSLRQAKPTWLTNSPKVGNHVQTSASLESVIFGNNVLKPSPSLTRLNQARCDHRTVCTLLLSSYESLQSKLLEYMKLLPPWQQIKIEVTNCYNKLGKLKEITKVLDVEDELLAIVNSDIAQLCAENIILWQQFLEAFTLKDRIQQHLAREHHLQRVKRFAEGFFVIENSRYSIFHCAEQMYQSYLTISESIRKTKYFSTLPSLGVECPEMDGGPETLPVIFEDHYQDLSRRKSSPDSLVKKKLKGNSAVSTNDVHLCLEGDQLPGLHGGKSGSDSDRRQSKTMPRAKESGGAGKKHKTVGCFSTGAAPKVHDDDACYGGRGAEDEMGDATDGVAPDNSLVRRVGTGAPVCSAAAVKKSFISAEELAQIKEDFKLSVIESKIYKTVPEWNGVVATGAADGRGGQSRRQEMFRSQTSKSLSAVEEAASRFVRSQSAHGGGGAMPRLDTVPLFSPLRHLDGGAVGRGGRGVTVVPPCLEDLRLHRLNSNAIATYFEIREFKSVVGPIPAIREKEVSNNNNNNIGSSSSTSTSSNGGAIAVRAPTPAKLQPQERTHGASEAAAAVIANVAVVRKVPPSRVVVEGVRQPKCGDRPAGMVPEVVVEPVVKSTPFVNGTDRVIAPVSVVAEFPDAPPASTVRPRDNLRLDLKSLNRMYDRANATAVRQQKEAGKGKQRRPNGLQCLRLLKAQSPTCSTSSDSIILMSYKRLEQSESLPVGLSSVGQRVASLARRVANGSGGEQRPGADGSRRPSMRRSCSMPEVCASPAVADGVDSAIATDSEDRRRSLAASESMPDLGASETTTLEEFPVSGVAATTVDCHWSSGESMAAVAMVVAPNASSEESDSDDSNDNVESDVVVHPVVNGAPVVPATVIPAVVVATAPRRRPRSSSRCSDSSSRSSSSVGSPSTSDSEHSGWVSSRRTSSDGSSADAAQRKPVKPPVAGDTTAAAPTARERHIYEEIHLPPEEFRDPPPLPAKRTSVPGRVAPVEVVPVPAPRVPRGTTKAVVVSNNVPNHHGTAEERAQPRHHRRAESSSSHDTGYKSERPTSRSEETSVVAGVHLGVNHGHHHHHHHHHRARQRSRLAGAPRVNTVVVPEPPPRGRAKARQRREPPPGPFVTAAYLNAECTILEMLADTGPCGRVAAVNGAPTHPWRRRTGAEVEEEEDGEDTGEYSNGVEDELALVPAPPPPASRRAGSGKEDSVSPSTATECEGDAGSGGWLVSVVSHNTVKFVKAKEEFKRQLVIPACLYSDCPTLASHIPYFHVSEDYRLASVEGLHLVICVHGLDGNSADLRLVRTYLELGLPCSNLEFLMSERNQGDTFSDFEKMTDKLVAEILYHIEAYRLSPSKISFIGHSLGNIIIRSALARPQMKPLLKWLHTFLSLSGPHLGTLYNSSGLVNMGLWFMQKWKKSGSLLQLSMKDASDIRHTFLYKLSQKPGLEHFRNILLFGSSQDRYVPIHSARIELCKAAMKDNSSQGAAYRDMVHGLLQPVARNPNINFVRYDVHHALPNTANSLIGRAAHIAVLDSELFIEKFLTVCGLKYFK